MATFPAYVGILFAGYGEEADPAVERTEMERGVPVQRLLNSGVMVDVAATLLFSSSADITAFEDWYYDTISRIGWFDMPHPRTGATVTARFKGGSIGRLVPRNPQFNRATRAVVLEYLRP